MAVGGSIKGRAELREVITKLEVSAPAELEKDLLAGTREALKPIRADVKAEALAKLPKRGGYAALLARSVKVSTRVTGGNKIVARVSVTASGKREKRDLPAVNRGVLRHPVFGVWRPQGKGPKGNPPLASDDGLPVDGGIVVDEPIDRARDRLVSNARKAAEAYARSIARG